VITLQALPGCEEPFDHGVGKLAGFSLHAGVAARADQRRKRTLHAGAGVGEERAPAIEKVLYVVSTQERQFQLKSR